MFGEADAYLLSKCIEVWRDVKNENEWQRSAFFKDDWRESFTSESVVAVKEATTRHLHKHCLTTHAMGFSEPSLPVRRLDTRRLRGMRATPRRGLCESRKICRGHALLSEICLSHMHSKKMFDLENKSHAHRVHHLQWSRLMVNINLYKSHILEIISRALTFFQIFTFQN